jgi:transcriptional regulator with XRE-family HTH domain
MSFGQRLQELRAQTGLSQSQLADKSGVPVWTLRGYEHGRRQPAWDVLFRLTRALGVSCEAFADCVPNQELPAAKPSKTPRGRRRKGK